MRYEEPTWPGSYFGTFGVLRDDGDRVQCHVCGDWWDALWTHANYAHGLGADDYRRAFGLAQSTKLAGPTYRQKRRALHTEMLRGLDSPRREQVKNLTTEERQAAMTNVVYRREHELKRTPPDRTEGALTARWGDPRGYPDDYLIETADLFLDELERGQRGVYRRLGERMGVDWSTARSRVMAAVRRGHLIWTGSDNEPAAHRPGEEPWEPPGSFEHMFGILERWVAEHGTAKVSKRTVVDGVKLGSWVQSLQNRYRRGSLWEERVGRLEGLPGWDWEGVAP